MWERGQEVYEESDCGQDEEGEGDSGGSARTRRTSQPKQAPVLRPVPPGRLQLDPQVNRVAAAGLLLSSARGCLFSLVVSTTSTLRRWRHAGTREIISGAKFKGVNYYSMHTTTTQS